MTHLPALTDIKDVDTWLLFLPLYPVQVKTPVVLSILIAMLLLVLASFVLLGHLLIFHFYLSMYLPTLFSSCSVLRQAAPWATLPTMSL
jgi:palmitoyltransferase